MTEPKYRPEDFELGELVGVYGPDPTRRAWLTIELGPPESDRLLELAGEAEMDALDLAHLLIREGIAGRLAVRALTLATESSVRFERSEGKTDAIVSRVGSIQQALAGAVELAALALRSGKDPDEIAGELINGTAGPRTEATGPSNHPEP
jgi:hypothetical protein